MSLKQNTQPPQNITASGIVAGLIAGSHAHDLLPHPDQRKLTARYIVGQLNEILQRITRFREEVDLEYAPKIQAARDKGEDGIYGDVMLSKYPLGFCRHIRDGVLSRMEADPFFQSLASKGLRMHRVFIFLQGNYFQNAIQLGNYYFDPANDSVYVEKPKLDWAPIEKLNYENVESWIRLADVAQRYLQVEVYPNLIFPLAFPLAPFFVIRPNGRIELLMAQRHITIKDLGDRMRRTTELLNHSEMMTKQLPDFYLNALKQSFGSNIIDVFPLEYAPCDPQHIAKTIIPEFIEMMNRPDNHTLATIRTYFQLIDKAVVKLRQRNICPPANGSGDFMQEGKDFLPKENPPSSISVE